MKELSWNEVQVLRGLIFEKLEQNPDDYSKKDLVNSLAKLDEQRIKLQKDLADSEQTIDVPFVSENINVTVAIELEQENISNKMAIENFDYVRAAIQLQYYNDEIDDEISIDVGEIGFMLLDTNNNTIVDLYHMADGIEHTLYEALSSVRLHKMKPRSNTGKSKVHPHFPELNRNYSLNTTDTWGKILFLDFIKFEETYNNIDNTVLVFKQLISNLKYATMFDFMLTNPYVDEGYLLKAGYPFETQKDYVKMLLNCGFKATTGALLDDNKQCYYIELK